VLVLSGCRKRPELFQEEKRRLIKLIEEIPLTDNSDVTVVTYVGDEITTLHITKPQDVQSVIEQIRNLPFRESSNQDPSRVFEKVKDITRGKEREIKLIPVGKLCQPRKDKVEEVKELIKKLEKTNVKFEFIKEDKQPSIFKEPLKEVKETTKKEILENIKKPSKPETKPTTVRPEESKKQPTKPGEECSQLSPMFISN
jgi:hypothetical protein